MRTESCLRTGSNSASSGRLAASPRLPSTTVCCLAQRPVFVTSGPAHYDCRVSRVEVNDA